MANLFGYDSAVKISNFYKHKTNVNDELSYESSKKRKFTEVENQDQMQRKQPEKTNQRTLKRKIFHLCLSKIESEDSTESDDSDGEQRPIVIHGKRSKGRCLDCQMRLNENERCKEHQWKCRCGLKCFSRNHFRNHIKQYLFQEEVYFERQCFYEKNVKDDSIVPNLKLKPIKFVIQIIVPFNLDEWLEFSQRVHLIENCQINFHETDENGSRLLISSPDHSKIRIIYLTCALFGWSCGTVDVDELCSPGKAIFICLKMPGVQKPENCSSELLKLLQGCPDLMMWRCEKEPPIEVFTKSLKARFSWSCYCKDNDLGFRPHFQQMGLVLFKESKAKKKRSQFTNIDCNGENYFLQFFPIIERPDTLENYFQGLSNLKNEDLFPKTSTLSMERGKKQKKDIQLSDSEWWRKPRILSQTRKSKKTSMNINDESEVRKESKTKWNWKKNKWNGEYQDFQKLAPSTQQRVFRDSFIPCIIENFGSFENFMNLLSQTNVFRKWISPRIKLIKKETVKKAAKKFTGQTEREEDKFNSLLIGKLSINQWNQSRAWSKRKSVKTGRSQSIRLFSTVLVPKLGIFKSWLPVIEKMRKYFTEHRREFSEAYQWKNHGKYLKSNEPLLFVNHLQLLWNQKAFVAGKLDSIEKDQLFFYLSYSVDGARLGKCVSSSSISFVFRIIFDEDLFEPLHTALVTQPIPWILASDVEKIETIRWYEDIFSNLVTTMNDLWNIFYSSECGFYLSDAPVELSDQRVRFRIFCYNGDAKIQQIRSGSAMSNAEFRCPHCIVGNKDWKQIQFYQYNNRTFASHFSSQSLESKITKIEQSDKLNEAKEETKKQKSLKNEKTHLGTTLSRDNWRYDDITDDKILLQHQTSQQNFPKRVPPIVQRYSNLEQVDTFLNDSQLWPAFFAVDPLHLIENHSERLLAYIFKKLTKAQKEEVESRFLHCTFLPLKESNPVWRWRLIWGSYPETWHNVTPHVDSNVDRLVTTWCRCISILYYPEINRNFDSWWKFFISALLHFTLWRETGEDFVLGIHFLWPHCVEQFWYVSFRTANTETHEGTWKLLKSFWANSYSSPNWMKIIFSKWIARQTLKGKIEEVNLKTRGSPLQKKLSNWKKSFPSYPDKEMIHFRDEKEVLFILQYLKFKDVRQVEENGKVLFQRSENAPLCIEFSCSRDQNSEKIVLPTLTKTWNHFGERNKSLFGLFSADVIDVEAENKKVPVSVREQPKPCEGSFVSIPLISNKNRNTGGTMDPLSGLKKYLSEQDLLKLISAKEIMLIIEESFSITEKMYLGANFLQSKGLLFRTGFGTFLTLEGFNKIWKKDYVDDEYLDTSFWFSNIKPNSKCFSIPCSYLQTKLNNYVEMKNLPHLSDLNMITGAFIFRNSPLHWGLIGFDVKKSTFFYGENLNSSSFILHESTFQLFKAVILFYFPQVQFLSPSFENVKKRVFPQQKDIWSCGVQISLVVQYYSLGKSLPYDFSSPRITEAKAEFIRNIVRYYLHFSN
jgi:hypothetical protein